MARQDLRGRRLPRCLTENAVLTFFFFWGGGGGRGRRGGCFPKPRYLQCCRHFSMFFHTPQTTLKFVAVSLSRATSESSLFTAFSGLFQGNSRYLQLLPHSSFISACPAHSGRRIFEGREAMKYSLLLGLRLQTWTPNPCTNSSAFSR